ncbi:EKC/KEOPS complex subunit Tprkb [Trichoplax sp. H2]|nr:EKC/KEOPS complex subunit Tprkb [Trichoplax sp. H2]|eukprot:RDD40067.1 EKC/KEOPS complex subunit Tprkb [Trichoplax sp. H2]
MSLKLNGKYWLHIALFCQVTNLEELKQGLIDNKISAAFINPALIVGIFQLSVAAFKAAHLQDINKMKTRNVHSELLYSLSPSKNIAGSFKKFGLSNDSNAVIVAVIDTESEENSSKFQMAIQAVKGERIGIEKINDFSKYEDIKKIYSITDAELNTTDLVDAVVNKMAVKDA